ncbi:TAXI family TRAP transporter solute-binding subunit [Nocardioides sp. R1-1]|uniref:TAXI family TRAP transporter solute-binding subunit n=1 Tax=Nocardioides sp. R1-1 TaxID=3383502 RepID=UPI0038D244E4
MPLPTGRASYPTRRALLAATAGAVGLASAGCSDGRFWTDATGRIRLGTGNPGAVFDEYGGALARAARRVMPAVRVSVRNTRGSVDNVRRIDGGTVEVGFCLGDTADLALRGRSPFAATQDLVALARLYDSFLQVVVRDDSPVTEAAQLRGRRVAVGEQGSGTVLTVTRTLRAAGVRLQEVRMEHPSLATGLSRLAEGTIDALCFVSGFPIRSLVDLAATTPLRVLDLGGLVPALVERYGPQYVAGPLPARPYRLAESVQTVSVKTHLVAAPSLPDDLAAGLTAVVFDEQQRIARLVPEVRQPTAAAAIFTEPLALHPGSLRYFRQRDRAGS